jgi:hypothetical protein
MVCEIGERVIETILPRYYDEVNDLEPDRQEFF